MKPALLRSRAFTLLELLVVITMVILLGALMVPALSRGTKSSATSRCLGQLRQLGLAMTLYADSHEGLLPAAHSVVPWTSTNPTAWTRQLLPYYSNTNLLSCPELSRAYHQSPYNYFMGSRAAFVDAGGRPASVAWNRIGQPSQYILSGDANYPFQRYDADPDNYTQDTLFGSRPPAHGRGVLILFGDNHVQSASRFDPKCMTYSYTQPGVDWGM